MKVFYGTCASGLEELTARRAAQCVPGFSALKPPLSGAVAFTCRGEKPECGAFHNVYRVVSRLSGAATAAEAGRGFLEDAHALRDLNALFQSYELGTFRVVLSDENKLSPTDPGVRDRFERAVKNAGTRRAGPDTEVVVLRRGEGVSYLLLRLTHPSRAQKFRPAGALRGDVADALVTLCAPEPGGVFFDPMAHMGELIAARRAFGPARRLAAAEPDEALLRTLRRDIPGAALLQVTDEITTLGEGEVTEAVMNIRPQMPVACGLTPDALIAVQLKRLSRVCADYARLAVLTGFKTAMEQAADASEDFELRERHDCLVSGAKLAMFGLRRIPRADVTNPEHE